MRTASASSRPSVVTPPSSSGRVEMLLGSGRTIDRSMNASFRGNLQ